jgi:hypothetical protein
VAQGVVYDLELVQFHEEHRDRVALPTCPGQGVFEAVQEQGSVRQSGQGVVERLCQSFPSKALCSVMSRTTMHTMSLPP